MTGGILAVFLQVFCAFCGLRLSGVAMVEDHASGGANERFIAVHVITGIIGRTFV
jgi:hypothetical protein